jgi:hypothetical protein
MDIEVNVRIKTSIDVGDECECSIDTPLKKMILEQQMAKEFKDAFNKAYVESNILSRVEHTAVKILQNPNVIESKQMTKISGHDVPVEELQSDIAFIFNCMTAYGRQKQEERTLQRIAIIVDAIAGGADIRLTYADYKYIGKLKEKYERIREDSKNGNQKES